jgi:metal-responsive CopG/Arc/MetJ family transcriptional regulator
MAESEQLIHVRVNAAVLDDLDAAAVAFQASRAELVRRALGEFLARNKSAVEGTRRLRKRHGQEARP